MSGSLRRTPEHSPHTSGARGSISHDLYGTAIVPAQMSQSSNDRKGAGSTGSHGSQGGPRSPRDTAIPRVAQGPSGLQDPYSIIAYLLSGAIMFGGAGWLADRWLGTQFLVAIGLLIGAAMSIYLIYVRLTMDGK